MKTIITILVDIHPDQEQQIVKFLDNYITTQFVIHKEDYKTKTQEGSP